MSERKLLVVSFNQELAFSMLTELELGLIVGGANV